MIDDNPAVGTALDLLLGLREIRTLIAHSPDEGIAVLAREDVDLVIQDMNFSTDTTSGEEGVALFRAIREQHPDLPIVLLTAWTRLETAIELVKAGAADYLAKPWGRSQAAGDGGKPAGAVGGDARSGARARRAPAPAQGARRQIRSARDWSSPRRQPCAWSNSPARWRARIFRC